jgi:4-aminobutyrate aminotransferase/(S)-3-amino-2-methylpropionate transaminase
MGKAYELIPQRVPRVETKYRRIVTEIPAPDSIPTLELLERIEPVAMRGQPPIVWDHAEGFQVYDAYGNCWIDWSSGVLITNAGHGRQEIVDAIVAQARKHLLTTYCFPTETRAQLVGKIASLLPEPLKKVFLLTTGSEATECAIKLARSMGIRRGGTKKIGIIGFERGFHGRTLGAQLAGGIPGQKGWIVNEDPAFVQMPFPDGYWTEDTTFKGFLSELKQRGMGPDQVAGVLMETYQGVGPDFAPADYVREMAKWCHEHGIVLVFDEVQAGFGRTGKFWAFEHYGVVPDIICCGKGISSSLPLSAVIGRADIMDQFAPGSMTSTHTGNPVCVAAALASVKKIVGQGLPANAARLERPLQEGLKRIQTRHPTIVGHWTARGLVAGLQMVRPGTKQPNHDLAHAIIEKCFHKGLLFFAPVGAWGQTVKIAPPLTITLEALEEGLAVLGEAVDEVGGE